jgi:hypothetical protein
MYKKKIVIISKNVKIAIHSFSNNISLLRKTPLKRQLLYYINYNEPIGKYVSEIMSGNDKGIEEHYAFNDIKAEKETLAKFNLNRKNLEKIIKENK